MTALTEEEIAKFKRVLEYSQNIPNPKVDKLLETWEKKKAFFIENFGGTIKEIPNVVFTLDAKTREERVELFISKLEQRYKEEEIIDLINFIELNRDGFFENKVVTQNYLYHGVEIPKGMKIVKAFKYFLKDYPDMLENIQNEASRLIQEDKIEGTLCFSVHPLDFLSASENTHNWRSCHALDGEYKGGNLSYMVDDCTFMCYLRSERYNYQLPNFPSSVPWNSKKWRVYLYLSKDKTMLMAGRQYPFSSSSGMSKVLENLFIPKIYEDNDVWSFIFYGDSSQYYWSAWRDDKFDALRSSNGNNYHFVDPLYPVAGILKPLKRFVKNLDGSLQFNDLLYSSCYTPMYSYLTMSTSHEELGGFTSKHTKFEIGGEVPCLNCEEYPIQNIETLTCNDCADMFMDEDEYCVYCDNCGALIEDIDIDAYNVEGMLLCGQCFSEDAVTCDKCGEAFLIEHTHTKEDENGDVEYYCENCWNEMEE